MGCDMNASNLEKVAASYVKLLSSLDWNDRVLIGGLAEGLNKFLSNAFMKLHSGGKYYQGDFYSVRAISKIKAGDLKGLIYEHMVPKDKYIQKVCEERAVQGLLDLDFVVEILRKYWRIAVISKEENGLLVSRQMPKDWDEVNIFHRYHDKGIGLISNPFISRDEIWDKLIRSMGANDSQYIRNTSGVIGLMRFDNGMLVIESGERKYQYPHDTEVTQLFFDGWYFDA